MYAQVEARKAELLVEIREMLSASAKLQPSNVSRVCPFYLDVLHRERAAACLEKTNTLRVIDASRGIWRFRCNTLLTSVQSNLPNHQFFSQADTSG